MSDSKGFTVTELLVSLALSSFLILGTMSFFVYQSKYGQDSSRAKSVRQSVDLVLMMIKQDITHAGIGLIGASKDDDKTGTMAVVVVNNASPTTDELYLSFGRHMSFDLGATGNIYKDTSYEEASAADKVYEEFTDSHLKFHSDEFNKNGVIGALIWDNAGTVQTVDVTFNEGAKQFEWTTAVTVAVPAVSYRVVNGILERNGVPVLGESNVVQVTDFQVSPYGLGYQVALRFRYRFAIKRVVEQEWRWREGRETVFACPRTVMLAQY